jgi:hypothetical protein
MFKFIISLTTIPSKFDKINYVIDSLIKLNNDKFVEKIIIHIPRIYSFRFDNQSIPQEQIDNFLNKYSKYNIHINYMDTDFGPGTKLIGLFHTNLINFYDDFLNDKFIIILDDDLYYKSHMIQYFNRVLKKNPNLNFASYKTYKLDQITIAEGCSCFFIKPSILSNFMQYYNDIKDYDYINYHDDVYISYFLHLKKIPIYYLKPHYNHRIYVLTSITRLDTLHTLTGKYSRANLVIELTKLLQTFETSDKFNYLK